MGIQTLLDTRLFAGGAELTSRTNKIVLETESDEKDVTTFLPEDDPDLGWKKVLGTIRSSKLAAEGFWEAGDLGKVDNETWSGMGSVQAFTICPSGAAVSDVAWTMYGLRSEYQFLGAIGDAGPWTAGASGSWPLSRGRVLNPPGTARTSTGTGTAVELGAVSADQFVYATCHVLSVSGTSTPTITFKIQSDSADTFGSPTDQITFSAATGIGGQIMRTAGAVTDTWWRAQWTVSGSTPSMLAIVAVGIQ